MTKKSTRNNRRSTRTRTEESIRWIWSSYYYYKTFLVPYRNGLSCDKGCVSQIAVRMCLPNRSVGPASPLSPIPSG
jgi:hypothetical protein